MKTNILLPMVAAILLLYSCSPKVTTQLSKSYDALAYDQDVIVLNVQDIAPTTGELLGSIKIGDSGFSTNCNYETVLELAKTEARKSGGNVLKITEHRPPSVLGSSCHQIRANVYKVADVSQLVDHSELVKEKLIDENADYATLHIYRYPGAGALVSYDLYLGNDVICRVKNRTKETIEVKSLGYNSIWAKTESKEEIPINLKAGYHYYIRCGIGMGIMVGRPTIDLVDSVSGKLEFESLKTKK